MEDEHTEEAYLGSARRAEACAGAAANPADKESWTRIAEVYRELAAMAARDAFRKRRPFPAR